MPNFLDAPEILPLPSLQAYSSISFLFLSCSLYYAFQITSEPDWKTNSSYIFPDYLPENITNNETLSDFIPLNDSMSRNNFFSSYLNDYNISASYNEFFENPHFLRFFDVAYVMVHEPLCVWTLINMGYCLLILVGKIIQKLIFGDLRASEHQLIRDKFWNFLFYKFIFVFSVINVQYMDELILWCSWFSILGFMFLLTYLCKERFSYLTFSPSVSKWIHFRLLSLLCFILVLTIPLFVAGVIVGFHTSFSIGAFLISECLLLFLRTLYCVILYAVHLWDLSRESIWEKRASINYYIELTFDLFILFIDFCHHLHMLFWGNIILSVSSLVILIQLRAIFNDINRRIKKHRNYLHVLRLMEENFPVASNDELIRNNDDCAICWDHMVSARKLPCGHLFHTTCLRSWLEQDTSCPTCRHSLRHREDELNLDGEGNDAGRGLFGNANIRFTNHFFHFDGPRYARWLPTVSVEVTPPNMIDININATLTRNEFNSEFGQQQIEYMGQQVLEWFPQASLSSIMEDLRVTRSVEHTIENILDGRLRASTSNANSPPIEENISTILSDGAQNESNSDSVSSTESSDSDISVGDILSMPSTSSTFPVHNTELPSNLDNSATEECDTTNLESRFMKLSSDERKRLLTRRKEEMFQKARNRFIQNNTLI